MPWIVLVVGVTCETAVITCETAVIAWALFVLTCELAVTAIAQAAKVLTAVTCTNVVAV